MASSSTQKSFDHSSIDYLKIGPRRAHMKAFFLHLGFWNEEKVKIFREYGEKQACEMAHTSGMSQINQVYFELMVDQIVWYNIIHNSKALDQGHDWPWAIEGVVEKTDVTTYGASGFYRDWMQRKQESKALTTDQVTPGASSEVSKASEAAPVQQTPKPAVAVQAAFGKQARRPLAEPQGYGISSSIWAPKPPVDNSADVSRVAAAFADINLRVAAGESEKKGKEKEKATAEAAASSVKAKRLDEKIGYTSAIYNDEVIDVEKQRAYINHENFLDARAKAQEAGCAPDDWHNFMDEDSDNEPVIPVDAVIPVRHDFGVNDDVRFEGPMAPVPEYLQDIWEELRLGELIGGPITGPFEIAIPEWCDFHDLVYGDGGALYAMIRDEALIDRDIVIAWSMKDGRPASLVVGPDPSRKCEYEDKQLWLRVRATWLKVAEWCAGVYYGRPHRLTDFLRYRQEQDLMGLFPLPLDDVMSQVNKRWKVMMADPVGSAVDARSQREELDVWSPQLQAILCQPWRYASQMATTWVMREGVKMAKRRLEVAEYIWAVFHPEDAYRWGRDVFDKIDIYANNISFQGQS